MLYENEAAWRAAARRSVTLFGMSGVGKTRLAHLLRDEGEWYHYSIDYRIGTRYLGEEITDFIRQEAAKNPVLRELLRSDSVRIEPKLGLQDLTPLTVWLGSPGDPAKGGASFESYVARQRRHREAEIAALADIPSFRERADRVYGYPHFLCDASGSFCEVVEPGDANDPVLRALSAATLPVYIRGGERHEQLLRERFQRIPKPMYYREDYLRRRWSEFLQTSGAEEGQIDPVEWMRFGFDGLLGRRRGLYQAIADRWGVTVETDDVAAISREEEFVDLIAEALARRQSEG